MDPSKIREGGVIYSLGKLKGDEVVYDFPKILVYLEVKGKIMFGEDFRLFPEDREVLFKLCSYFIREEKNCKRLGIDPNKGILLSGPVGCGKTTFMRLLRYIVPHQRPYQVIPTRNITFGFNHIGYKTIEDYGNEGYFCFDDLGVEPMGRFFGQDCNVMGEVLLSRYELFLKHKVKSHITTNLSAEQLEERYGQRVRSRMRQFLNMIPFDAHAKDKRK